MPKPKPRARAAFALLARLVDARIAAATFVAFALGLGIGLLLAPKEHEPPGSTALAPPPPVVERPAPVVRAPPATPAPPPVAAAPRPPPPAASVRPPARESSEAAPWRRFAVAAPPRQGRPAIAVIIDDMGVDRRRSAQAIALPGPLTLSFLPYAEQLDRQTEAARAGGHELMLHLPMEAESSKVSPGPNALSTTLGPGEILSRLHWNLDRFSGYVGVNNHMGSRFTADAAAMRIVLGELDHRGLLFVDSRTSSRSAGQSVAKEIGMPAAARDVFLDNVVVSDKVEAQLAELERVARAHGQAIAIGHPHDATLAALAHWLPTLPEKRFVLQPVSALVAASAARHAQR